MGRRSGKHRDIDIEVVKSDYQYIIRYLEEALEILSRRRLTSRDKRRVKRLIRRVVRRAHASLIGLVRDSVKDKTVMVNHLVVDKKGRIRHYGIHGLRGHSLEKPDQVQFMNKYGEPVEYEEIGEVRDKRHPARKRVKRTRRIKKTK